MKYLPIKDFCATGSGGTPSRSKMAEFYDAGTIPWIKSGELARSVVDHASEFITEKGLEGSSAKLLHPGAILVAMYGATVGQVSRLAISAATNQAICHIYPDPQICDRHYLYRVLKGARDHLLQKRVGGGQPNISQGILREFRVPLPPLTEQKRIAQILDAADALRAKRRESIAQLDALVQSTFLEMFGDPVNDPNVHTVPIHTIINRFIDYRGKSPVKRDIGIPLITAKIVKKREIQTPTEFISFDAYDAWMRRGIPEGGDVVITTEAPMGEVALVPEFKAAFAQRILILQPDKTQVDSSYLMWALTMPFIYRQLQQRSTGSTVTGIRSKEFKKVLIPLPELDLQCRFNEIINAIKSQRLTLVSHLNELNNLFASLQSRAFNGEL